MEAIDRIVTKDHIRSQGWNYGIGRSKGLGCEPCFLFCFVISTPRQPCEELWSFVYPSLNGQTRPKDLSMNETVTEHFPSTLTLASILGDNPSTPTISPSSFIEEEEEQEKLDRKILAIKLCGMEAWGPNPSSGGPYKFHMRCGHWRQEDDEDGDPLPHCPYCLEERTVKFRMRGERCRDLLGDSLGILQMSEKEFSKLARKFRKNFVDNWRIPIEDSRVEDPQVEESQVIVLFDASLFPELGTLSYDDLNWRELCQTPKGKRYTGSLCREKENEIEKCDDDIIVETEHIVVEELSSSMISSCWEEVMRNTDHLNPAFDKEEIERACWEKMSIFKQEVLNAGGVIIHEGKRRKRVSSKSFLWNFNPDNVPTKENLSALMEQRVLDFNQAVEELFLL